jgi:hypothetical protein
VTRLFFDDIRALAIRVYQMAGRDETKYPDQAGKVLADIAAPANNPGSREELAVKGLAAEAVTVARLMRVDGYSISPDGRSLIPPKPIEVEEPEETPPEEEPETVEVSEPDDQPSLEPEEVFVELIGHADNYFGASQLHNRFGVQSHLGSLHREDWIALADEAGAAEEGSRQARVARNQVVAILDEYDALTIFDLPPEARVRVFRILRSD